MNDLKKIGGIIAFILLANVIATVDHAMHYPEPVVMGYGFVIIVLLVLGAR